MKNSRIIVLAFMVCLFAISCCKEEEEIETCSCITAERKVDGSLVSTVNSAEETPISGNCLDLNFTIVDPETGNITSKLCL